MNILMQTLVYIIVVIEICLVNKVVYAGQIFVKDYEMDYINTGYTTQFKFTLKFENGLGAKNLLQLTFPFQIYISSLSAVSVQYTNSGLTSCATPTFLPATITADQASSKIYYILFLDNMSNPVDLLSDPQWYTLYIQTERGLTATGMQLPIAAVTQSIAYISNIVGKPILYDANYQFALLEFTVPPPTTLKVTAVIPSPRKTQIAWQYDVSFVIEPKITISDYARIIIIQKQTNYFTFSGTCVSEQQLVSTGIIPPLDPSIYKCTVDTVKNRIVIEIKNGLKTNLAYRFRTNVINPSHVVPNAGFEVRTMLGFSNQIIEQADLVQAIYTDYLTWGPLNSSYKVYVGNNIDLSDSQFINKAAIITLEGFYNPYKFQFSPSLDTPDNVKLKIIILLPVGNFDNILTGSIKSSLPRFSNTVPVKCMLDSLVNPTKVICSEIGKLLQQSVYYITASIFYGQTVAIPDTFGTLSLISIHPIYGEQIMIQATKPNILSHFLMPKRNLDRVDYSTDQYGYQMVHSQVSYDASSNRIPLVQVDNTNYGIKMCNSVKQKLVFAFKKGANNEFGVNSNFAMRFITSTNIKAQPGPDFYVEKTPDNVLCDVSKEFNTAATRTITTYNTFTEILLNPQSTSNCIQSETKTTTFSIGDVSILAHSSSYADDYSINFYGALYDSYFDQRPPTRYFAVNAFTISMSGACNQKDLQNIQVTLSNFYTSSGPQVQKSDGQQFPAFIRVTGYFTDAEKLGARRVAVFFNNVDFYSESIDEYGRTLASCASSSNMSQKCEGFNGQSQQSTSIHSMKRIEFDVSTYIASVTATTPIQLLIPVSAIDTLSSVRVFVSLLKDYPSDLNLSSTFLTSCSLPSFYNFVGTTAAPETRQQNTLYKLESTQKKEGFKTTADLDIGHTSVVPKIERNTDTAPFLTGAAFVITGDWKMYSDTFSVKEANNIVNTSKSSELCIGFRYNYLGASMRYGIYCPFSKSGPSDALIVENTKVTFQDFLFPALGPLKLDNTFITWSQNNGSLVSSFEDPVQTDPASQLQPNDITNVSDVIVNLYTKDNRVVWLFTSSNPIPKDGRVQISLVESNSWLFSISEGSDANCYLMYQTDTFEDPNKKTCTVSIPVANNVLFTLTADQDYPAGQFKLIQYGLDASINTISVSYAITITTQTSQGGAIDQQSQTGPKLSFDTDKKWNTVINIYPAIFSHDKIEMSYGTFQMDFQITYRPILALSSAGYGDKKGQNLEILVAALVNQEPNINCLIMKNQKIFFGFKFIQLDSANSIKFYPRDNIISVDNTFLFTLRCENVSNQYKNIQQYQVRLLYRAGQNEIVKGGTSPSGTSNPPYKNPSLIQNLILTKINSLSGASTQLKLTMTLLTQVINQSASIFVTFPTKYNPRVGTSILACKVNNVDVYCQNIGSDRKIQISAFPQTIAVGTAFSVDIYGISSPVKEKGDGNIQVLVGSSIDASSIVEGNIINDPATISNISSQLLINYATQTNSNARESGLYSYKVTPTINSIALNRNIQIEFPQEFGTVISINPPTSCKIYSIDKTITYGDGCNVFGSKISISVTTVIPVNTVFLVEISQIQNPEQSSCNVTKVIISVLSQDFRTNEMTSSIATSNQPFQTFSYSTTLKYLNWYINGTLIKYNLNMIQVVAGVYSNKISLIDPNGNFSKMLTYSLKTQNSAVFTLISDFKIYPGQTEETFRIGCPSNTIPGVFTLSFSKDEQGTQVYGNLGLMNIKVSNTQVEITPAYKNYKVSVTGQSLPVYFDLSESIPYNNVSVLFELQIMGYDPKIDILNDENQPVTQYTINFSPKSYKGRLLVRSSKLISPVDPAHKVKLKMTIFGTDAASYMASTQDIIFQLYDVGMNPQAPALDFKTILQTPDVLQTSITLIVNVNIPSAIYYHVRFQTGPIRPLEEVMLQVNKYTQLNPMDIYQEQFGVLNAEQMSNSFVIQNLRSKQNYIISTWAYDQLQRQSTKVDNIFTTKNNGGKLLKVNIKFANIVSIAQKLSITCYLCQLLAIPCLNVMSFDSIYCDSQSKFKLEITDSVNVNMRRQLLEGGNQNRQLADTITSAQSVQFYILPLDEYATDTSSAAIIPIIQSVSFALQLNTNDPTLPQILAVENPVEVQPQTIPSLINQPVASTGITWFQVDKIETQSNSLIWMYLVDAPNGGTPSSQQMKFKLTNRNQTSPNFKIFYFDSTNQVSYNFTDLLPDTQYLLYLIATSENPSLFAPTSFVSQVGKKTLSQQVEVIISGMRKVFSFLLLICLAFFF